MWREHHESQLDGAGEKPTSRIRARTNYFGDSQSEFSQQVYDEKPLNCVPYLMAQAFCIWDGGRLETFPEWQAAWGAGTYPWGASPITFHSTGR